MQLLHLFICIHHCCGKHKHNLLPSTATTGVTGTGFLATGKPSLRIYTVNHKKGGSTFVSITLKNLDRFL